jgi:hypothetical protein
MLFILYIFIGNVVSCSTAKRIGAECCDETFSDATGSGACSWHGGVRRWRYKYWYSDLDDPYCSFFKYTIPGTINSTKKCEDDE